MPEVPDHDAYFVMDESGDGGFLENEPSKNSFGIIAGFAFPARNKASFEEKLKELYSKLDTEAMSKVRSAYAFVGDRNADVKEEYVNFFLGSELLIVYEALFLKGVFIMKQLVEQMKKRAKQNRRNTDIVILTKEHKEDVYFEVLTGLIVKLDEICNIEGSSDLAILTDTVDKSILHEARKLLKSLSRDEHVSKLKSVDKGKGEQIEGAVISKVHYPVAIKNLDFIGISDKPELTFAADFLSNSIYRHLKNKVEEGCQFGLNSKKIMRDFPLVSKIALLDDNSMTDRLFSPNL